MAVMHGHKIERTANTFFLPVIKVGLTIFLFDCAIFWTLVMVVLFMTPMLIGHRFTTVLTVDVDIDLFTDMLRIIPVTVGLAIKHNISHIFKYDNLLTQVACLLMFPCLFDVATVGLTTEHTAYLRSISRCFVQGLPIWCIHWLLFAGSIAWKFRDCQQV